MPPRARQLSTQSGRLAEVEAGVVRAANVERDLGLPVEQYVPMSRSLDVVQRWVRSMAQTGAPRAWSITGPYGSGKSSLALFLAGLAGPGDGPDWRTAERLLRASDPDLAGALADGRRRLQADRGGFARAVVTADREAVAVTITRALYGAIGRHPGFAGSPEVVRAVNGLMASVSAAIVPSSRQLIECIAEVCRVAPLLLVIDEFGKNLEYHTRASALGDAYVLQELAEASGGSDGLPLFIFTLQHLAYADYVGGAAASERREWSKIQGRFEDLSFVSSRDEITGLIARSIRQTTDVSFMRRLDDWSSGATSVISDLGLDGLVTDVSATIRHTYPMHPMTLLVLPDLCSQFGQSERSLFGFLAQAASELPELQALSAAESRPLPTVGVDRAYDYFIATARAARDWSGPAASRWNEVETRIREAEDLSDADRRVLRVVGLLNLVNRGGPLRASPSVVAYCLGNADRPPDVGAAQHQLAGLVERGFLTFRSFADEYRIWQGSDFDLDREVARATAFLRTTSAAAVVAAAVPLQPIVALRHSQETGVFRFFDAVFADESTTIRRSEDAGGVVVFWVGAGSEGSTIEPGDSVTVVVESEQTDALVEAAIEAAALRMILKSADALSSDWVARREATDRVAEASSRARACIAHTFEPGAPWTHVTVQGPGLQLTQGFSRWSRLVSDLCDERFRSGPRVRNEMLSRDVLTKQAARARRTLMEAIVEQSHVERLGIYGYGPERAMYEAVLVEGGFHKLVDGRWELRGPLAGSSFGPAWTTLNRLVDGSAAGVTVAQIADQLREAPLGIPRSLTPILVTILLVTRADDLAVYQDGTFQPNLSSDFVERMTKIPARFSIRSVAIDGTRDILLASLRRSLGIEAGEQHRRRNDSVLAVVAPLLSLVRGLPFYTLNTRSLPAGVMEARDCLIEAREPDRLLFENLPVALGLLPFTDGLIDPSDAERYAEQLGVTVRLLRTTYRGLLKRVAGQLAAQLGVDGDPDELRREARVPAILLDQVFEPRLRAFLHSLADTGLDDEDWLAQVAMTVVGRPPRSWRDEDETRFGLELRRLVRALQDAEALSFEALANHRPSALVRRLTVSRPGGEAASRVVWLEPEESLALQPIINDAIHAAAELLGPNAVAALTAALTERLQDEETEDPPWPERKTTTVSGENG
jgi:hypothetical protein